MIAADRPEINEAAEAFRAPGVAVVAVETDLATLEGVDRLHAAAQRRPVDALLAEQHRKLAEPGSGDES